MSSQRTSTGALRNEQQGRRPPPLKLCRESQKIRKPGPLVPSVPSVPIMKSSQPMIIHLQSPKIIHAEVQDFMNLVQRLTGSSSLPYTTKNENLTVDHDSMVIWQASDVTMSSQPAGTYQNMGPFSNEDTPCGSNPSSLENDRSQKIKNRPASAPEATGQQSGVTSLGDSIISTPVSPFSPNFSQVLLSPNIFEDLPLFSPDSNGCFYRLSESIFSPHRPRLNTSTTQPQSPCPTTLDVCRTPPEH